MENPTPTIPLPLHRLRAYNPGKLTDEELKVLFVVRQDVLARIVDDVVAERDDSRPQHHLVVGQRGMGKTTLLLRIAAELRGPEHRARFIPLVFAEEQYTVDRLSKFWLNCLDSLADAFEREGDAASARRIEEVVRRLDRSKGRKPGEDAPVAREAHAALMEQAGLLGRRLVLLVDNLQLVFDRIGEQEHELRGAITAPGAPIFVAAAPQLPRQTQNYGAAFYDQFKTHYLNSLSVEQIGSLLLTLAQAAGNEDVPRNLDAHPARLHALHDLAGGVPRTIVLLFHLFAGEFAPTVYEDLEKLLDEMTPLYKARFEDLSDQMQVIAAAMAEKWDPIDAKGLVEVTNLPTNLVSAQLDRLTTMGMIEKVELHGTKRDGFQIAERFFNVWLMMRASRRQRKKVEWFSRILETVYAPNEREGLARSLYHKEELSADQYQYALAVQDSLNESQFKDEFERVLSLKGFREQIRRNRRHFVDIVDLDSLQEFVREFADVRERLNRLLGMELAVQVLRDWRMWQSGERNRLAERPCLSEGEREELEQQLESNKRIDTKQFGLEPVNWLARRLSEGQLVATHEPEEWTRVVKAAGADDRIIRCIVTVMPRNVARRLPEMLRVSLAKRLLPKIASDARLFLEYGSLLSEKLCRPVEAEAAYRKSLEIAPGNVVAMNNRAYVLSEYLHRPVEAGHVYRKAILLRPESAILRCNLANLLQDHLGRYDEAEKHYREALKLDEHHQGAWIGMGVLYSNHRAQYSAAENSFRRAIDIDESCAYAWVCLGDLLSARLGRFQDADAAYRRAQSLEPRAYYSILCRVLLNRDILLNPDVASQMLEHLGQRFREMDEHERTLLSMHRAVSFAYDLNWGRASSNLVLALENAQCSIGLDAGNHLRHCTAVLVHLGYGEPLLELLRERGDDDRLRPFYEGLRAVVVGDKRMLLNVAPEVRVTAERFYDLIETRRQGLPEKTAAKKPGGATKR